MYCKGLLKVYKAKAVAGATVPRQYHVAAAVETFYSKNLTTFLLNDEFLELTTT